jgi:hypothetical protein
MVTQAEEARIKAAVRKRDQHKCRRCGMTSKKHREKLRGKDLEVHRLFPGSEYSVNGCITLCRWCHGLHPTTTQVRLQLALSQMSRLLSGHDVEYTKENVKGFPQKADRMLAELAKMFRRKTGIRVSKSLMLFAIVSQEYKRVMKESD